LQAYVCRTEELNPGKKVDPTRITRPIVAVLRIDILRRPSPGEMGGGVMLPPAKGVTNVSMKYFVTAGIDKPGYTGGFLIRSCLALNVTAQKELLPAGSMQTLKLP
jgi:hypothetical protein